MVGVGEVPVMVVKTDDPTMKRFSTSWAWQLPFNTEVRGSAPMRVPPA